MSKIRNYNESQKDKGGYANNTLNCYDHKGIDNKIYKNIYCYSEFIDELLFDRDSNDNIKIVGNRISATGSYGSFEEYQKANNDLRKVNTQSSGYWTTWTEASGNKWITSTSIGFNYNRNYKDNLLNDTKGIGVGPSWK